MFPLINNIAIKKSGSRDFWDLQYYLLEETRNHVKKFIATHYIFEGKGNVANVNDIKSSSDLVQNNNLDTIVLSGRYNAIVLCKYVEINTTEFNQLNPNFNIQLSEGKKYEMKISKDKTSIFFNNKYKILNESIQQLLDNK